MSSTRSTSEEERPGMSDDHSQPVARTDQEPRAANDAATAAAAPIADVAEPAEPDEDPEKPKRHKIVFKSAPPTLAQAKKKTTIVMEGVFARNNHHMTFYNRNRGLPPQQGPPAEAEEVAGQFAGMEFTHRDFTMDQQGNASSYPPRRNYAQPPRRQREYDKICFPYKELLTADDANELLRGNANFEERINKIYLKKNAWALPESLIWRDIGNRAEYMTYGYICPRSHLLGHRQYTSEERAAEKYRMDVIYELICQEGMVNLEDLYKAYLRRNRFETYPFDAGFIDFYYFIKDRAHVFGMDLQRNVYNQNLIITAVVMRYAHALHHDIPVEKAPSLFKAERSKMFYRAFLGYMNMEELSFDRFFEHFPALFKFDCVWKLHPKALDIPCAFEPELLPRRDPVHTYVDRSQYFSGTGKIISKNLKGLKIESDDCLRRGMRYLVEVRKEVIEDEDQYEIGMRVAYTGVLLYNGEGANVRATSIELLTTKNDNPIDGTIDIWHGDDDDTPLAPLVEETKVVSRLLDLRETMAAKEKRRNAAMLGLLSKQSSVELLELWEYVKDLFEYNFDFFIPYIEKRPWFFQALEHEGKYFIAYRSKQARRAMVELLIELKGIDDRHVRVHEAIEMCAEKNKNLPEEERFTLDDLSEVTFRPKGLRYDENGKPVVLRSIVPSVNWDREHQMLIQV